MKRVIDAKLKPTSHILELEPFGVTGGMDKARPVMLFREKNGEAVLPVWLSPLDAGIALTQHNTSAIASSPHDVTLHVLSELGVKAETCHFSEVRGHMQYAEVTFSGSKKLKTVKSRADHAVSFCLQAKVKFYCTREFLEKCREVDAEIGQLAAKSKHDMRRNRNAYLN
ncbi:MAG: bifunctional nuclease family protein [Bdellovibrionales bacterium]